MTGFLRLGVNIDHVATIRNARGGGHPDPRGRERMLHRRAGIPIRCVRREWPRLRAPMA